MKDQFVTYEIAKSLNEFSFNEPTFGLYKNSILYRDYETFQWTDFSNTIKAPLWSQSIDWLRNEHNIHIEMSGTYSKQKGKECWFSMYAGIIYYKSENKLYWEYESVGTDESTFHESREAAILKAIEIINSTKNGIRNTTI